MARLILTTADGSQQAIELRTFNSLGRHPNNTLQLLDKIVSKEHCVIEQRNDIFVLRDLGSLNGTFINDTRVRGEGRLRHGDKITLGATEAYFEDPAARQPSSPQHSVGAPVPQWPGGPPTPSAAVPGVPGGPAGAGGVPAGAPHGFGNEPGTPARAQIPFPVSTGTPYVQDPAQAAPRGLPSQPQPPTAPISAWQQPQPPQQPVSGVKPIAGQPQSYADPSAPSGGGYARAPAQAPMSTQGQPPFGPPTPAMSAVPSHMQPGPVAPSVGQKQPGMPPAPPGWVPQRPAVAQQPQPPTAVLPRPPGTQVAAAAWPFSSTGMPGYKGTPIDVHDEERAIGTQIAATQRGFLPFDQISQDLAQVRADYERLRLSHELSREIALERDTSKLLDKILGSVFKFIRADRGVIFLRNAEGQLVTGASRRRDGSDMPIHVSATIMNHVMRERAAVLTHDAAMDFAASKGKSMILNRISSAIVVPLLHNDEILGVLWLDSETVAQFQRKDLELVTAVVNQAAMFIEINILGQKVEQEIVTRERFSRLLSPNVAERVISGQLEIKKGGELVAECTVFNSDIRGFTRMSESTDPQHLVDMLNEYFELMVETIFKFEGTLDKFMGDGIMALWGAPVQHPDDPVRSVQCALDQMRTLADFNRSRQVRGLPTLAIGIGIHTGPLVAGYIGSSKALSYTVVGDTANTSARLCGIAQPGHIIVSEPAYARLGGRFECEELQPAHVKGKEHALRIFNILRERQSVSVAPAYASVPPPLLTDR